MSLKIDLIDIVVDMSMMIIVASNTFGSIAPGSSHCRTDAAAGPSGMWTVCRRNLHKVNPPDE